MLGLTVEMGAVGSGKGHTLTQHGCSEGAGWAGGTVGQSLEQDQCRYPGWSGDQVGSVVGGAPAPCWRSGLWGGDTVAVSLSRHPAPTHRVPTPCQAPARPQGLPRESWTHTARGKVPTGQALRGEFKQGPDPGRGRVRLLP